MKAADPSVRGNTAGRDAGKSVVLETGAACKVPTYVAAGDRVVVNTKTGDFVKRVK